MTGAGGPDEPPATEPGELSASEARDLARDLAVGHREQVVRAATARAGIARAEELAAATGHRDDRTAPGALPSARARRRWGWHNAVRFAVQRRMLTPDYLALYARYLFHRLRHPHVAYGGLVFFGPRVELIARRGHGRLELGPWCWIGADNRLRAHEGSVRVGPKVVLGRDNVVNAYLDVEIGENALLSDWIYVTDFDHRYADLNVPIRKQGIVKGPVRIGSDVWIGEKASVLRGADIGTGSVIGSQTLVKGTVPPFSVAVGRPARVIKSRLPAGMSVDEALDRQRRGLPIPGDPLQ